MSATKVSFDLLDNPKKKEELAEAVSRLEEQEQLIVKLYYSEDLEIKEIGEVLGLSSSRVSQILAKIREELRMDEYLH